MSFYLLWQFFAVVYLISYHKDMKMSWYFNGLFFFCARDCSGNPFRRPKEPKRLERKARPLGSAQSIIVLKNMIHDVF